MPRKGDPLRRTGRVGMVKAITRAHGRKTGTASTRTKVTRWTRGAATVRGTVRDATVREVYDTGKLGKSQPHPRGGTYRPVVRSAGWKAVSWSLRRANVGRAKNGRFTPR